MSRCKFMAGLVLWTLTLGALYSVVVQKISQDATPANGLGTDVSETNAAAGEQRPIVATQKTAMISFPSRELPVFEFPESMGEQSVATK